MDEAIVFIHKLCALVEEYEFLKERNAYLERQLAEYRKWQGEMVAKNNNLASNILKDALQAANIKIKL